MPVGNSHARTERLELAHVVSCPHGISRRKFLVSVGTAAVGLLAGCCPTPQSTPTPTSAPTGTPQPTDAPTDTPAPTATPMYWPTDGWRTSTPEEQGMDSEQLAQMVQYVQDQGINLHSILVVRNGYVVTDAYIHPFSQDSKHVLHSATKSIVSLLVGIAIDKGYIRSVNQPVLDFFPGRTIAHLDSRKKAMTLEHLLTMTTGLDWQDSYENKWRSTRQMQLSQDWIQYMLDFPMAEQPGTRFEYCNGASFLLSAIVQEATGMSTLAFAEEYLFRPLGTSDVTWLSNPQAVAIGYGRIWMNPYDMAKIGYLCLNGGLWDGQQLISSAWIEASTRSHITTPEGRYGYQWWVGNSGIYQAKGFAGQRILVLPEQDVVVVFTGGVYPNDEGALDRLVDRFIIPSVGSSAPQPENPKGVELLESRIQTLANPGPDPVPPLPETAQSVSGKRYLLDDDIPGWRSFSLEFQEQEALVRLFLEEESLELPIGLDGLYRVTHIDQPAFLTLLNGINFAADIDRIIREAHLDLTGSIALKGFWLNNNQFVINEQIVGEHEILRLALTFGDKEVDVWEQALVQGISQRTRGTLQD